MKLKRTHVNKAKKWYEKRKCQLSALMCGVVVKRRKSIYPKSTVKTITKPSDTKNASCLWGTENEKNAMLRYHQYKDESNLYIMWVGCEPTTVFIS